MSVCMYWTRLVLVRPAASLYSASPPNYTDRNENHMACSFAIKIIYNLWKCCQCPQILVTESPPPPPVHVYPCLKKITEKY